MRVGKGDKPVTYEEAHAPHYIGHRKGWLSLHTGGSPRDLGTVTPWWGLVGHWGQGCCGDGL